MPHIIRSFAPGVGAEAPGALAAALAAAGREVLHRRPPATPPGAGVLRWEVRRPRARPPDLLDLDRPGRDVPEPAFLVVDEVGAAAWDLVFLRELSALTGGPVGVMDDHDHVCRYAVALFLAGRTVEVAETSALGRIAIGRPEGEPPGPLSPLGLHGGHARALMGDSHYWLTGDVVAAEDWTVAPARRDFEPEPPEPLTLMFLPGLDRPPPAPGWTARTGRAPGGPYTGLRRPGGLDPAAVAALSAGAPAGALALEVSGAGAEFRWAAARDGRIEAAGTGRGAAALCAALERAGPEPGWYFGREPGV